MKRRVTVKPNTYIILIVAFLLCVAIVRLIYVSVSANIDGVDLKEFAASRNTKTRILHASRGIIYDSNGEELASSVNSYTLIAYLSPTRTTDESNPQHVVDKEMTARKLSEVLDIEESKIIEYLNKKAYQVEFGAKAKNLTEIQKKKIEELELPGIDFIESVQRYYKMGNFASYIVGYAKEDDEGNIKGELGIESYFDDKLAGEDGYITYQSDAYGYQLPNVPSVTEEAASGDNIYLTIDSNVQLICENAIRDLADNYDYDFALITIMDAKTGAIVASATDPNYNPNDLNTLDSYLNPLVSYTYEPGSTMKIFSWASAIEEGIYKGDDTYKSGSIDVADVTINDHNKTGWGTITYDYGFAMSSNVAATKLALKLGKEKLYDYYSRFGFGKKVGIELSGEVEGDLNFKYQSELAAASFGQGRVTVTPVQMLQALSSITNDGVMLKPYVVSKIVDTNDKVVYENVNNEVGKVMEKSTAKKMQELMYNANYDGLSKMWQPTRVKMMAKTGTAQIPSPKGGYLDGEFDNIYSVAGIFPTDEPKYIIYAAVKRIVGTQRNFANVVTKVVDEVSSYANLNEEPEENNQNVCFMLNNYKSQRVEEIKESLISNGFEVVIIGDGEFIVDQYPSNGTKIVNGTKIFLVTNSNNYSMPNIIGWSLSDVKTLCNVLNINYTYSGYGYVKTQSIEAGSAINSENILNIELETRTVKVEKKENVEKEDET